MSGTEAREGHVETKRTITTEGSLRSGRGEGKSGWRLQGPLTLSPDRCRSLLVSLVDLPPLLENTFHQSLDGHDVDDPT